MNVVSVNCTWCVYARKGPENNLFCSCKEQMTFLGLEDVVEALFLKDANNHFCSFWKPNQTAKELVKKDVKESKKPKPLETFDPFDL